MTKAICNLKSISLIVFLVSGSIAKAQTFVPVYRDLSNGLYWSKPLQGAYSNGCIDENGTYNIKYCKIENGVDADLVKINESSAALACINIDANLPTREQYYSLIRQFSYIESETGPFLTEAGRSEFKKAFGAIGRKFWTVSAESFNTAYFFYADYVGGVIYTYRDRSLGVMCVKEK